MAILETRFNRNDQGWFKYDGKIYCGVVISIEAKQGIFCKHWDVYYNLQTGEDQGVDHIPQEHFFPTREAAEQDVKWENRRVKFFGYRNV